MRVLPSTSNPVLVRQKASGVVLGADQSPALHALPRRQPEPEPRVLEDVEIGAHDLGRDAGLARDAGVVEELARRDRGDAQELAERGEIAHQRFPRDLLAEVVAEVGAQLLTRLGRQVVRW